MHAGTAVTICSTMREHEEISMCLMPGEGENKLHVCTVYTTVLVHMC